MVSDGILADRRPLRETAQGHVSPDFRLPDQMTLQRPQQRTRPGVKNISLALQGGGSHGAFTWGVMHRLMSEPRFYIDGISGTSAGAMNAAVFADGFIKGKRQGAIDALATFWGRIADLCQLPRSFIRGIPGLSDGWGVDNDPTFMMVDFMTRIWAPTQLNPFNMNPLRDLLEELVDFEGLRRRTDVKLFVTASNVRTCKSRTFRTHELTAETLLALGLPAADVQGHRDRRRILLGWRLSRQSGDPSADQ